MTWYKIKVNEGGSSPYAYVGSSPDAPEIIAEKVARGEFVRLEQLLYMDRGKIKEWTEWDDAVVPTVYINPQCIVSIMPFKGDPRVIPRN